MSVQSPNESRSAQLLRTTLMRDDAASASTPSHRRSPSSHTAADVENDEQLTRASFLFRSAVNSTALTSSPTSVATSTHKAHGECDPNRPLPSPSSLPRAPSPCPSNLKRNRSPPAPCTPARKRQSLPPMTPPELALRQRLERVLNAQPARPRKSSNEVTDESGECPWRVSSSPRSSKIPTPPPTPPTSPSRRRCPIQTTSPSRASIIQHSYSPSCSPSSSLVSHSEDSIPPLSLPPLLPSNTYPTPTSPPHHPRFNARKASESLKHASGYVSFASVEGLGGPPGTPVSEDEDLDGEGEAGGDTKGRGRGRSMSAALAGTGRAWMGWMFGVVGQSGDTPASA
ncbi:hypothetical protein E4T56_gene678 [Termitomyces sp. T112]|nr:hypothetical protein E4T56_gene678 [Termitomyces sp. T112]